MQNILKTSGVAACGVVTSVLTAIIVTTVARLTGLDLFSFSMWLVIPVGAIATGVAAASGYYFGSLYFHTRPTWLLFVQMVAVAGFTFYLIYYLQYATMILPDGRRVSDIIGFSDFFDISVTSAHYRVGRGARDTGEIGEYGYWLAIIQFVGFLLGGIGAFLILWGHPVCQTCKKYLRDLAKSEKQFNDAEGMAKYHDALFALPLGSPEFENLLKEPHSAKAEKGILSLTMKLSGCPECKGQKIGAVVSVFNGTDWKEVSELRREYNVPADLNLVPIFRTPK